MFKFLIGKRGKRIGLEKMVYKLHAIKTEKVDRKYDVVSGWEDHF